MEESNITSGINEFFSKASWLQFELLILIIIGSLLAIKLIIFILDNLSRESKIASTIQKAFQFILDHIEPFVILLLFAFFIRIDPILHGVIALVICICGYRQIRDYITGKALKYNGALESGSYLTVGDVTGEIEYLRRLGVQVVSKDATHFFSYVKLYDNGFTIHANDSFGGNYSLHVQGKNALDLNQVKRIIVNSPYTDDFTDIRMVEQGEDLTEAHLSVHLRNANHLEHLKQLLRNKGFECS